MENRHYKKEDWQGHRRHVNKDNCPRGREKKIYNKFKHERLNTEIDKQLAELPPKEPRNPRFFDQPKTAKEDWLTIERMSEESAGMTEYINKDSKPFTALFKYRFSDFHVHEIGLDGNVAHLTSLKIPRAPNPHYLNEEERQKVREDFDINDELLQKMQDIADSEETDDIVEFDVTDYDKAKRTKLHSFLKITYKTRIVAETYERDGKKFIKVFKYSNREKALIRERNRRWTWKNEYTHFILSKENMDTIYATIMLAGKLRTVPNRFVYAGTKDRRSKSSQWMCARKMDPYRIAKAVENMDNVHVGNFVIKDHTLKLGMNKGNHFQIALKQVEADKESIEIGLESIRDKGFINYYGLQRFGNCATVPTFMVGIQLLKSNYKAACDLILQMRDGEPWYMKEMRRIWNDTRDAKLALSRLLNTNNCVEARILRGLQSCGENNYYGALSSVPRNMRLMYLHSYQSYVWNQIVSKRIAKYGLNLIEGDLVYVDKAAGDKCETTGELEVDDVASGIVPEGDVTNEAVSEDENDGDAAKVSVKIENSSPLKTVQLEKAEIENGEPKESENVENLVKCEEATENSINIKQEIKSEENMDEDDQTEPISAFKSLVKPLTKEDIEINKYTIYDIVLPLPGHDITFPHNEFGDAYHEVMAKDGISLDDMKNSSKEYSLTGAYRKVLVKPENFSWRFMQHNDLNDCLIQSDIGKLNEEPEPENVPDGKLTALILELSLPTCVYATMALRELMKLDTSVATQLILTKKANQDNSNRKAAENGNSTEINDDSAVDLKSEPMEASQDEIKLDISTASTTSSSLAFSPGSEIFDSAESDAPILIEKKTDTPEKRKIDEVEIGEETTDTKKIKLNEEI